MLINLKEFLKEKHPNFTSEQLEKEYREYLLAGWTPVVKISQ